MFSTISRRWLAGTGLGLVMIANLVGVGSASAQTMPGSLTVQGLSASPVSVATGATVTISGSGYGADENVSFWINAPDGTKISPNSLGQTNSYVTGNVIPLNTMIGADDNGAWTLDLNTSGLPAGSYSLVAHGLSTAKEDVLAFTVSGNPAPPLAAPNGASMTAGTMFTVNGSSYRPNEEIGFWINVPAGLTISNDSLGQDNTKVIGTVIPLGARPSADANGNFTFNLDTTGLPAGNYSLVAHGLNSKIDTVIAFTIQ
jgi:hypothetical protein